MLNRKLLEVLHRLSTADHKQFRLMLESPYYTQSLRNSGAVLRLYDYIISFNADESHPDLAKSVVFSVFFPDRIFQEKEKSPLDALASDLFGLVRRFLALSEWENKDIEQQELFTLLRFYRKYGLEERFWHTIRALRKWQTSTLVRDARYFLTQFQIEEEVSHFEGMSNTFEDDANLFAAHENLDTYYSILKLEYTCALNFQHKESQIEFKPEAPLIQAVLNASEIEPYSSVILIKVYKLIFNLIQYPENEIYFADFEQILQQQQDKIPTEKYRDLTTYYRYFLSRRYVKVGGDFSRQRMFEVYKDHFERGFFYIDGLITANSLRTLIIFALKLGHFEWAKNILDIHTPERICSTKYPVEAYNLNFAEYYFYKNEYEKAKGKLTYRLFENPHFSILADLLLIKIYFETEDELLDSRMKALEQKVRRTKISAEAKSRYYNFLNKLDKVIRYGWQKDSPKRSKLIEDIKTIPNIIQREWLLEKSENGPN